MIVLYKNLKDFFSNKKKFFLIQLILVLILTLIFVMLNLKKSFHYKINYTVDYSNHELYTYNNSYKALFRNTLDKIFDPNAGVDKLKKKGMQINFQNPEKFLDLGYSDIDDIFFVKKSSLDTNNHKIEIVTHNKNFKIDKYRNAYNTKIRNYFIAEKYKNEKTVKEIIKYLKRSDKNPFFDEFFYRYDLKYSLLKDLVGKDNIIITDNIGFYFFECTQDLGDVPDELFLKISKNTTLSLVEDVSKEIDISSFIPERFLKFLNCTLDRNIFKIKNKQFLLREKLINLLNQNEIAESENLEKIKQEILETINTYLVTPNKSENDKFKIYLLKKETIKENIKIVLENDKTRHLNNLGIVIKQINKDKN